MPYSLVLERASGTHNYSVQRKVEPTHLRVLCSVPVSQAHSNKFRLAALEALCFISLWCLGAQRKGMVIIMANMFDKYSSKTEDSFPDGKPVEKSEESVEMVQQILKKVKKIVRKHKKMIKKEAARRKAEEEAARRKAEEEAAAQAAKRRNSDDFPNSFKKAICKALPQIMRTIVTGILGFFFKRKSRRKILQVT